MTARVWHALLLLLLFGASALSAQVDPRGRARTLRTEHFRVHFEPSHEALARRAAAYAELAWTQLASELAVPDVPIEVLVADNLDVSNGFATPFPTNRIVVYALPPQFVPELRHYDDWLQLVILHELAHIFTSIVRVVCGGWAVRVRTQPRAAPQRVAARVDH
jgi:hypothetical protein